MQSTRGVLVQRRNVDAASAAGATSPSAVAAAIDVRAALRARVREARRMIARGAEGAVACCADE